MLKELIILLLLLFDLFDTFLSLNFLFSIFMKLQAKYVNIAFNPQLIQNHSFFFIYIIHMKDLNMEHSQCGSDQPLLVILCWALNTVLKTFQCDCVHQTCELYYFFSQT